LFVHLRTVMARPRLLESLDSPAVADATARSDAIVPPVIEPSVVF
jgi:hypothetical protein